MKDFIRLILLGYLTATVFNVSGQIKHDDSLNHELKVGDQFPTYRFTHVLNHPSKSIALQDFTNKLVILDLWSTSCTGCILSWPKLLSLQEKYKERIQIILINPWQTERDIRNMFVKRKKLAGVDMNLPTIYGDTTFLQFFPTSTVPHIVWVDQHLTVRSISHGTQLNEKNIVAALQHENFKMPQKSNNRGRSFDASKPLYINGNGGDSPGTLWQSILTTADPSLWRGQSVYGTDSMAFCLGTNVSVSELFQMAYGTDKSPDGGSGWMPPNRIIFEVTDPDIYLYKSNGQINEDNFVSYSLFGPAMAAETIQEYMKDDLRRYFPLEARWDRRKSLCYVWKCSDTTALSYKSGDRAEFIYTSNFKANKITMAQIFWWLNYSTAWGDYAYPMVDETGLKGLVGGISEEGDVLNPKALSKMLAKYNITISLEERTIPFLIVRERKTTRQSPDTD